MKANELQIGDYVNYRGRIIKVTSLYDKGGSNEVGWGIKEETWVNAINVEPIPLTPEIFEKNGFEKCEGNEFSFYKKEEERALYQVLWSAEELYLEIAPYTSKTGEFNRMGVEFVHQLQHALRLCGIEKEIDL